MPFKLKLHKKSRQYNVVSKNLYVIAVELLDNTVVECTLSSESTGQDCLSNVCVRLGLNQPEFFGLHYCSKSLKFQWIDLGKPLKKQLDKYAQETYLYLGVMFYISDVNQLHDEMTRYQYFLQVKSDIIEGRLLCKQEQAVLFASYSLQAEFGKHDHERHTVEYLKGFVLLPKYMTSSEAKLEELTEEVVLAHRSLGTISPASAEIVYIVNALQLEGYGREVFQAKDEANNELQVGVSLVGIVIKNTTSQTADFYDWSNITNLTFHKRTFGVECEKIGQAIQLQLEDATAAKYIWKVCVQQHQFYVKNKLEKGTSFIDGSQEKEKFSLVETQRYSQRISKDMAIIPTVSSCSLNGLKTLDDSSMIAIGSSDHSTNESSVVFTIGSQSSLPLHGDSMFSLNSASHSSIIGYNQNFISNSNQSLSSAELKRRQNELLPHYRPAPDYETAVQRKYGTYSVSLGSVAAPCLYSQDEGLCFQQQDVNLPHANQCKSYFHYKNFTDLASLDMDSNNAMCHTVWVGNGIASPHRVTDKISAMSNLTVPPTHTYSTPELASQKLILTNNFAESANVQNYQHKLPPPYPYNQRSSTSTPDLASQTLSGNRHSSSSPDLVSRNQLGSTFANLNYILQHSNMASGANVTNEMSFQNHNTPMSSASNSSSTNVLKTNVVLITDNNVQENNHSGILSNLQEVVSSHESIVSSNYNPTTIDNLHSVNRSRANSTQSAPETLITSCFDTNSTSRFDESKNASNQLMKSLVQQVDTTGVSPSYEQNVRLKENRNVGPMMIAAMNGLTLSRPDLVLKYNDESRAPKDNRRQLLESRLAEGLVFLEFEQVPKKRVNAEYTTALLPENGFRNRFKDVLPYEDNRVRLAPSKDNKMGYINASHLTVTLGQQQKFYIAAQGPLAQTVTSFWQMIWEQHVQLIVMLTEVQEQGRDKCYPYWPTNDKKLDFGEYVVMRKFSTQATSYVTSSLMLLHVPTKKQRIMWHIQYTDWPDHGCPEDIHGFLNFMEEVDSVRRHAAGELPKGKSCNFPVVIHCSAGVGRSGVTILTDIMLFCLDHNENIDVPKMLAHLRQQRMLTVQTVAQYKFVYSVLIQYLKNSRLI